MVYPLLTQIMERLSVGVLYKEQQTEERHGFYNQAETILCMVYSLLMQIMEQRLVGMVQLSEQPTAEQPGFHKQVVQQTILRSVSFTDANNGWAVGDRRHNSSHKKRR